MFFRRLGNLEKHIPELGIGTWHYHAGPGPLRKGLEAGALFIDTAESYGTENVVGEAIAGWRDRVFVATKVSAANLAPHDLRNSVKGSLQRLHVDQIDLFQLHNPNPSIPIDETMGEVGRLIDAGKIRYAGVSNFSVAQLREAQRALGRYPVVSNQLRYNLIDRTIEKDGLLDYCRSQAVTVIAYSPLARGLNRIQECDPTGVIAELSRDLQRTPAQIVLNWCLCQDGVVAIPKGNSEDHIVDNCGASGWRLSPEHLKLLDSRIRHRHRTGFDALIRRSIPSGLQPFAGRAINLLPAGLRRRLH